MQTIENDLTAWAESNVVGILPVDDQTTQFVLGYLKAYFKGLEGDQVIQPGWTVVKDPGIPTDSTSDFIPVLYGISFTRDTEQVLNTVVVQ
jgi:hypothetical protein